MLSNHCPQWADQLERGGSDACQIAAEIRSILAQDQLGETWTGDGTMGLVYVATARNISQEEEGQLTLKLRAFQFRRQQE